MALFSMANMVQRMKAKLGCCSTTKLVFFAFLLFCLLSGLFSLTYVQISEIAPRLSDITPTPFCIFPHLDPFDPLILPLSGRDQRTFNCTSNLPDLTYIKENHLVVDVKKIKEHFGGQDVQCEYQDIRRHPTSDWEIIFGNWKKLVGEFTELESEVEFLRAVCKVNQSTIVSNMYHSLIPTKTEDSELFSILLRKRSITFSPKETLNVVLVGFDGVSRQHFLRSMNKTYGYLMKELRSFDLEMFTQVGKDTFENYLALLGGTSWDEVKKWWGFKNPADSIDLIWHSFKKAGYRTLFTEDAPTGGAFHYQKKGFLSKPTHYNSRPVALAMERDNELWLSGSHCVGNQPEFIFHMDYLRRFLDNFEASPVFAFSFLTKLTHDDMTNLAKVDDLMVNVYKQLHKSGQLNRTMLITFSDHGPRVGRIRQTLQGIVESKSPYTFITLPPWFLQKYPQAANNLKTNSRRLTTHFDTYATMRDLLYFESPENPLGKNDHGISLFREIPLNRSCLDIPIPFQFCLCGQSEEIIPLNSKSKLVQTLVTPIMAEIRKNINITHCANITLKNVTQIARVDLPHQDDGKKKCIYKVRLQTSPGDAIFEGSVFAEVANEKSEAEPGTFYVSKVVERLNLYRGQAECVEDTNQRLFCFCKDNNKSSI